MKSEYRGVTLGDKSGLRICSARAMRRFLSSLAHSVVHSRLKHNKKNKYILLSNYESLTHILYNFIIGEESTILSNRLIDCVLIWRRYSTILGSEHTLASVKFPQIQLAVTLNVLLDKTTSLLKISYCH